MRMAIVILAASISTLMAVSAYQYVNHLRAEVARWQYDTGAVFDCELYGHTYDAVTRCMQGINP